MRITPKLHLQYELHWFKLIYLKIKKLVNHTVYKLLYFFCFLSVGVERFELPTPWSQTRCANRTALHPEKNQIKKLRREGDSNPRYSFPYVSLANWWFQPLTHPSGCFSKPHFSSFHYLYFPIASANVHKCFNAAIPKAKKIKYFFCLIFQSTVYQTKKRL